MDHTVIEKLEMRLAKLEKIYVRDKENLQFQIESINIVIHQLKEDIQVAPNNQIAAEAEKMLGSSSLQQKVEYLTAANEHMFQQNHRLRQLIEEALEKKQPIARKDYYLALRGDE